MRRRSASSAAPRVVGSRKAMRGGFTISKPVISTTVCPPGTLSRISELLSIIGAIGFSSKYCILQGLALGYTRR